MEQTETKIYVKVIAEFTEDGRLRPVSIVWKNGKQYPIDRIRKCQRAASLKAGGAGIRYTVLIYGEERYLFYEENFRWFVEAKR